MSFFIIKIFITAILIVLISEIAKFNDRLGGIIGAMPITTFLILFWLYYENSSLEKFLIICHILCYMSYQHCQCL